MIPISIIEQITIIADNFSTIDRILLFGSRAYGDHQEDSDIDLAVIAPRMQQFEWLDFSDEIEDKVETLLSIDLIKWEGAPETLQQEINNCYQIVYSRN
ncbi:nucleotidyltransferase domain-containing protein [Halobacillus hunanensis]|uniref:nucleotidyltransferase domain-containing protein n=1 Tax=Halobacillus hunanensis TaxID=578214 RepID=UPI001FE9CB8B|nr:nucleotidyltransferase domain-containing protein [Halobacillus hunanensis]